MANEETSPSGIEEPRERPEQADQERAAAEAPLEFAADEFGLEPPPEFGPPEALSEDDPATSLEEAAPSEAETGQAPAGAAQEALPETVGGPANGEGEPAAASASLSEAVSAEEAAGAATQASGDASGGNAGAAPEAELEPGVPDESAGAKAAGGVPLSELFAALEQPTKDSPQAAGEESPPAPGEMEPAEAANDSELPASDGASMEPGSEDLDVLLEAAARAEPESDEAEVAVEGKGTEGLPQGPPEDRSEVSPPALSVGEAAAPEQTVDVEPPAAETSTGTPAESSEAIVGRRKLADLPPAPTTAEEEDAAEAVSARSLEALIQEIDEKVALLPGEGAPESEPESDSRRAAEQYIAFTLAGLSYALPITQVSEIEKVPRITWAPNLPAFVLGVANMRGDVMAVLDLSQFLGFGPSEPSEQHRIIVVSVGSEALTSAFVVDRVHGLAVVNTDRILEPSGPVDDAIAPLLRGLYEDEDRLLQLLDMEKMFRSSKMQQLVAI